jgi:putative YhbY family RNA-binding protein
MTVTSNLSTSGRRALRAAAHHLDPVVMIGDKGLTPSVLHEIDLALTAHALIKVRVFADDREVREAFLTEICTKLSCASVQHLGKLLVLWRNVDGADAVDAEADAAAITAAQGRRRAPPAADAAPVARGPRSKLPGAPGSRDGNERTPRPAYGARNDAGGAGSRRRDGAPSGPRTYGQGAPAGGAGARGGAGEGERRRYGQQTWDTGPAPRPGWAPRDRRGDARGQTGEGDDRSGGFGSDRAPRGRAPEGSGAVGAGRGGYGGAGAGSGGAGSGSGYRGSDRNSGGSTGGYGGGNAGGAAPRGRWGSRDSGGAGSGGAGGGGSGYRGGGESGGAGSGYRGGAGGGSSGAGGGYGNRGGSSGSSGSGYGGNRDGFTGKPRGFAPRGGGSSSGGGGGGSAPPRARRRLG